MKVKIGYFGCVVALIGCGLFAERARVSALFSSCITTDGALATAMDTEAEIIAGGMAGAEHAAIEGETPYAPEDIPALESKGVDAQQEELSSATDLAAEQFDSKAKSDAVVRLVEKGVAFLAKNNEVTAFQAFSSNKDFVFGELYLFVYDIKGTCLAHGQQAELIWKNLYDLKDIYGVLIVQQLIEEALKRDHNGWASYEWRGATKISYVQKVVKGDKTYIVGSGYYPHSKVDAVENLVKSAVALFNDVLKRGRPKDEALSTLSYPLGRFVLGDLYLYALTFEGIHVAHGELPGIIGTNGWNYRDANGKLVNQEIVQKLRDKSSGGIWIEYSSKKALKKTYAERVVDDKGKEYFIACGFYPSADRRQVVDLVKKGYQYMKANGRSQATKMFSDQRNNDFRYGDLYLVVYTSQGECVAHGGNPSFVGTNDLDMKDEDGQFYVREMIRRAQAGPGWINYKLRNSFKSSYFEKVVLGVDDYVISSGLYPVSKYETMYLLARSGADYLKSNREEQAYNAFVTSDSNFVRGDLFVFAIDTHGICFSYGPDEHDLIWHNIMNLKDDAGKPFVRTFINRSSRGAGNMRYKLRGAEHLVYAEPVEKDGKTIIVGSGYFL